MSTQPLRPARPLKKTNSEYRVVKKPRPAIVKALDIVAIAAAAAFFAGMTLYLLLGGFALGFGQGMRSLAACLLPLVVIVYLKTSTTLGFSRRTNVPFNLFFIYSVWTMLLLSVVEPLAFLYVPIIEFLFSTTLMSLVMRFGDTSRRIYACCYGILTGILGFTLFFGSPFGFGLQ
ncbi:MAG: hypothetical protein AAGF66_16530 [Cyanobacteria bacterium P01_H01_bin.119]